MQPLNVQPEHYWPGATVPLPLPDGGVYVNFTTAYVVQLPTDPSAPPGQTATPGWDSGRPASVQNTGIPDLLWHFTGEGLWVDMWVLGLGVQGPQITLWEQGDDDSWHIASMPSTAAGLDGLAHAIGIPSNAASFGSPYRTPAALRVFLQDGVEYVLQVNPASLGSDHPEIPHGFGGYIEEFYMELSYTNRNLNDLRAQAWDVTIAINGATYTSDDVLNTNFTSSDSEDPQGRVNVRASAWWRYEPTEDGAVIVSFAIVPQYSYWFRCVVFKEMPDKSLIVLAQSNNPPPQMFTVPLVQAGDVLYIQIYSTDFYNEYQPYAQKYQLEVTGVTSAVQNFFARVDEDTWLRTAIPTQPLRLRLSNTQWKTFAGGNQGILKTRSKDHQWLAVGTAGSRYGVVKGYVIAGGTIVVNHFVWVEDSAGTVTPYTAWTDANGYFEIIGVPLGHAYTVKVRIRETYPDVVWDDPFHPTNDDPVHTPVWWADGPAVTGIT